MMEEKTRKLYVELPYEIGVSQSDFKNYEYLLRKDGDIIGRFTSKNKPRDLSTRSPHIQDFLNILLSQGDLGITNADGDFIEYTKEQLSNKIIKVLEQLQSSVTAYNQNKDRIKQEQRNKEHDELLAHLEKRANELCTLLEENKVSLNDYIDILIEWVNGGEYINTKKGMLCHLATYFKILPIWLMVLGRAGEGKSVIDESARKMLPAEAFQNGRMSESSLHRKSKKFGKNYLDGKIMVMGDMGGDYDMEKWNDTIARYKELTTEGRVEVEKVGEGIDNETGERVIVTFEVCGYCSVTMTSVHSEKLDDQILSRGINITPKASNEEVNLFAKYLKGKVRKKQQHILEKYLGLLHDYIRYIYHKYRDVEVINLYEDCVADWMKDSKFFKRNRKIIMALIETVTLLNFEFRETIVSDEGDLYVISTKEDNILVTNLFDAGFGLTESARLVQNKLVQLYSQNEEYEKYSSNSRMEYVTYRDTHSAIKNCKRIFTVATASHSCSKTKSLARLDYGAIIKHLTDYGFIEAIGKMNRGNKNVYALTEEGILPIESSEIVFDDDVVSAYIDEMSSIYGVYAPTLRKIEKSQNEFTASPTVIFDLEHPPWVSASASEMPTQDFEVPKVPKHNANLPQSASNTRGNN